MRCMKVSVVAALAAALLVASNAAAQNQLDNAGFESPITMEGVTFDDNWEGFSGNAAAIAVQDALGPPRTGSGNLHLSIDSVDNTFAGAFQDVPGLVSGQPVLFSTFHKANNTVAPVDFVAEFRIEWRNAANTAEVSRTQILVLPTADYTQVALPDVVPAGAAIARVVYAVQTFTDAGTTNNADVFLDDASFVVIPEPATFALAGLAGVALVAVGRRRK